ncbi:MAG: hypothetical protein KA165_20485 [Saprospiraceae bacterium]|nr:hypothetical protein [Saprospiraceae bacterium]
MDFELLKNISGVIQTTIAILALMVGGIWTYRLFVLKRQRYPKADIEHDFKVIILTNDKSLLIVTVTLRNSGEVVIHLKKGEVRISQVLPLQSDELESLNAGRDIRKTMIDRIEADKHLWPTEIIPWPELHYAQLTQPRIVEPGNSEQIVYDFVIDSTVKVVRIQSFCRHSMFNHKKKIVLGEKIVVKKIPMGWTLSTTHELNT